MENPLLVLSRFRYPGLVNASPTFCSDSKRKKEMRQSLCEEMLLELTDRKSALIPFPFAFKNESNLDWAGNIRDRGVAEVAEEAPQCEVQLLEYSFSFCFSFSF